MEETVEDVTAKTNHFQKEITVKEECIIQLRKEIEELGRKQSEANITSSKELDKVFHGYEDLNDQFNSTRKELEIVLDENKSCHSTIDKLEREKKEIVETLSITRQKLLGIKNNLDERNLEFEEMRQCCTDLENKLSAQNENINIREEMKTQLMCDENKILKDEVLSLQKDLKCFDGEYKRVTIDNTRLKESFEKISRSKTALETTLGEVKMKFELVDQEKIVLEENLNIYHEIKVKTSFENSDQLQAYVTSLEDLVQVKIQDTEDLSGELLRTQEQFETLQNEINTSQKNETIFVLEEKMALEKQLSTIQDLLNEKTVVVDNLTDEVQQLSFKMEQSACINAALEALKDEMKCKDDVITTLSRNVEELTMVRNVTSSDKAAVVNEEMVQEVLNEQGNASQLQGDLKEEILHLEEELEKVKQAFNDARVETKNLKTSEENHLNEMQEKNILVTQFKGESDVLRESLEGYGTKLVEMKRLINELQSDILEKVAVIGQLSLESEGCKSRIEELKALLSDQEVGMNERTSMVEVLNVENGNLKNEIAELSEMCRNFEIVIAKSNSSVNEKFRVIEEQAEKVEKLIAEKADLKSEVVELLEKCQLLEKENDEFVEEIKTKEKHLQGIIEGKVSLLHSLHESSTQQNEILEELEQYQMSQQQIEEELQSALNKIDELEQTLKDKKDSTEKFESLAKDKGEKAQKFRNVALKAKKEMESLKTQFQEVRKGLEKQICALMEEVKINKSELVHQKTECAKHEEEFEVRCFFMLITDMLITLYLNVRLSISMFACMVFVMF